MTADDFVNRVAESAALVAGLTRLRTVLAGLTTHESMVLMGKGLNYSRHKNHRTAQYNSLIFPCHTDYTEHKDHR